MVTDHSELVLTQLAINKVYFYPNGYLWYKLQYGWRQHVFLACRVCLCDSVKSHAQEGDRPMCLRNCSFPGNNMRVTDKREMATHVHINDAQTHMPQCDSLT